MKITAATYEIGTATVTLARVSGRRGAISAHVWTDKGAQVFNEVVTNREEAFEVGQKIAILAYGQSRKGGPKATNSMVWDITNAVETLAGA
jgi:hypothetical protein